MKYLSICSGIEAASVAWHPLGWEAAAFAEIDAFPSEVLSQRWTGVPNLGDFTKIEAEAIGSIDVLVGGTPCQSFSIAGLRGGLADDRGNLALEFLKLAQRTRPRWVVWENVPGVLSSNRGRDFGTFLGALGHLGYGFAYRVLDAQYFGLAQRRKRVFVVGYLGDWRRASAVLFERESLSGHPAPGRCAQEGVTGTLSSRNSAGGGLGTDFDLAGGVQVANSLRVQPNASHRLDSDNYIAHTLNAKGGSGRIDAESETSVTHSLRAEGFDASEDGTGRGTPLVPIAFDCKASGQFGFQEGEISPTLRAMGHKASHQNAGGQIAVAVSLRGREGGATAELSGDICPALRTGGGGGDKPHMLGALGVRRLTPRECERLQGFPDDYTKIDWRGKPADQCPDGPRYRALGNSMAVPCMRWIGERMAAVELMLSSQEAA